MLSYDDVLSRLSGDTNLLLGNGFSIGCDTRFSYSELFEHASKAGLDQRVLGVFRQLGTCNFEGVLELLDRADWLAAAYGLWATDSAGPSPFRADYEAVKEALITAISETHPPHANAVTADRKACCADFLRPYHSVFTTNYDLLLYWVEMADSALKGRDGFGNDPDDPDAPSLVFVERLGGDKGLYYLHGALHLFNRAGHLRKHTFSRTGEWLTAQLANSLEAREYPLFVAEGTADKKREQINRSGYLTYCLEKLARLRNPLVVYGLSFGPSDDHICHEIVQKRKIKQLYVGLYGNPTSDANQATMRRLRVMQDERSRLPRVRSNQGLQVEFYASETAPVWRTDVVRPAWVD